MAHYHLTTKNISRGSGKSCVASLAYRSATQLVDLPHAESFDYTHKPFVEHVAILLPPKAPAWLYDLAKECETSRQTALQKLSDSLERAEKRKDARVYRELEFSLPHELTHPQNIEWALRFVEETCTQKGMLAVVNFHFDQDEETGQRKPHCHVLLSTRKVTETGFSLHKQRDWNRKEQLQEWREQYAQHQNAVLKAHGFETRVDHRSYAELGLHEITPQPKYGHAIGPMAARGIKADKKITFDGVRLKNQFQIMKNPELVFSIVTACHSTFTRQDLAKVLHRYIDDNQQYQRLYHRLLHSAELIPLDPHQTEPVFTTRSMLQTEMNLVLTAETLACQKSHAVKETVINQVITAHDQKLAPQGGMSVDQKTALRHILGDSALACVVGYAGAGKTTALEAAAEAWHDSGYRVLGLAPTGKAADNLAKGGLRTMTLHRFLKSQKQGREKVTPQTIIVMDEASMVDSRRLNHLLTLVKQAGSKIVLIGDGSQLQAVEAGPAFRLLIDRVQPAVLETVLRQSVDWQRHATCLLGRQETTQALTLYQQHNTFHIISEPAPNPQQIFETYALARLLSGRIGQEIMQEDANPESVIQHQAYEMYRSWKTLRQEMLKQIVHNFDNLQILFSNQGLNSQPLEPWVQQALKGDSQAFETLETVLRSSPICQKVDTRTITRKAMVQAWANDFQATPQQTHLMLAFTRHDVQSLNQEARSLMRHQGRLTGQDFAYTTQRLETDDFGQNVFVQEQRAFAKGDRLVFTRNDTGLGVQNGSLGTILSLDPNKIIVQLDENHKKVSFAPRLYPFIDHGWATTIHKAQGVTVDHVKKLACYEEYRNLTYVGMSRHRHSLQVFASDLDFWHPEKLVERLSRIQEKLSGLDYKNADSLQQLRLSKGPLLWHDKKLQQGRDWWQAVKGVVKTLLTPERDQPQKIPAPSFPSTFENSEEKRSVSLFKVRENLAAERANFEAKNRQKYHDVCEFFIFREWYDRAPTPLDQPVLQLMGEKLTQLAGEIFAQQALKNHTFPKASDIAPKVYQAFAQQYQQEKAQAEKVAQEKGLSREMTQAVTAFLTTQKGNKASPESPPGFIDFVLQRAQELTYAPNQALASFQLLREMKAVQSYAHRHEGALPTDKTLKSLQKHVHKERENIDYKIRQQQKLHRIHIYKA